MLLRKHQYIAFFSASLSVLALANCSDNDGPLGESGGSSAGKAGANEPASGAGGKSSAGAGGKAHAGSSQGGSDAQAGDSPGMAGDSSEGGGAGKPGAGAGGGGGSGGSGGMVNHAGSGNPSDAGEGGMGDDGGAAGAGEPTGPHANAILKYNFDAGAGLIAADSSGSGLNGTLSVATAWTIQGRNGAGLALTGGVNPTTYVTVPPGVFKGATAATIATWVKLNADLQWNRIFDFGNGLADPAARFMYLTTNKAAVGVFFSTYGGTPAREPTISSGTFLPLNVWKHVAVTVADDGKRAIYLDGFPAAETTPIKVPPSELEPLSSASYLGKSRFADPGLNGTLDEFMVYDRVLAPAEIATLAAPKGDYARIPFDEGTGTTSSDTSTRAVNATLTGATWASGRLGAAVQLSGTAQYVTLSSPLAGCTEALTISMWVKPDTVVPWSRLLDFGGITDNFMFLTPSNGTGMQLNIHTMTTETVVIGTSALPLNSAWHHVAVVVSPTLASIYLDGASIGSTPNPVTPAVLGVTNENWLGKSRFSGPPNNDPYFKGAFDEVRIACRAYTPDEIKSLAFH